MALERRCPSCGALVSADAEWCGQCFTRLGAVTAAADLPTAAVGGAIGAGIDIEDGKPAWTCPACQTRNPIEASVCAACGTPFAKLLREPEETLQVPARTAAAWSLVFPGLGHWKLGLKTDAIARFAMFGWAFGALVVLLVSRVGKGGLGPTTPLFVLFATAAIAIYVTAAVDAHRLASDEPPLVSSRALLWTSAGLVVLSVLIATFVTLPAARR